MIFMRAFTKLNLAGPIFCDVYTAWSISLAALACILTYPTGGFFAWRICPAGKLLAASMYMQAGNQVGLEQRIWQRDTIGGAYWLSPAAF